MWKLAVVLQVLLDSALNTRTVIKPNPVSTNTTFKGKCGCRRLCWRPKHEACGQTAERPLTGPDLCFCQNPKIEGMKKNERGNGDVLLCISQVAVILRSWFKMITNTNLFLYISVISWLVSAVTGCSITCLPPKVNIENAAVIILHTKASKSRNIEWLWYK